MQALSCNSDMSRIAFASTCYAMVLVRRNYINCIHAVGRAVSPYLVLRPDGQQQCVLFAFCCSKDESGRTSVRPLSEI